MTEKRSSKQPNRQPVSRHPLFPATVALWFGALFGLGSLAVRPQVLESLVLSSHLDVVVTAAAPPLGMTARILLALALAGIGGTIGATLARWIARPKVVIQPRRRAMGTVEEVHVMPDLHTVQSAADGPAARAELREAEGVAGSRRRALAIEEDGTGRNFDDLVPLPGGAPQILDLDMMGLREPAFSDASTMMTQPDDDLDGPAVPEPLQLTSEELAPTMADEPAPVVIDATPEPAIQPAAESQSRAFDGPAGPARAFASPLASDGPSAIAPADLDPSPEVFPAPSPMPVFMPDADSMQRQAEVEPGSEILPAEACDDVPAARYVPPTGAAADRIASADVAALSNVELIERLAIGLLRRRQQLAASVPAHPPVEHPAPEAMHLTDLVEEAHPLVSEAAATTQSAGDRLSTPVVPDLPIPPVLELPAALRPIAFDGDDTDQLPTFIPARRIAIDPAPVDEIDDEPEAPASDADDSLDEEARALEDGYSSLLDWSRWPAAPKQQFVRVEEPESEAGDVVEPVVVFPGQSARAELRLAEEEPVRPRFAPPPADPHSLAPAAAQLPPAPETTAAGGMQMADTAMIRRFDAPASGLTAASTQPVNQQDPEETERALRAALATLQRMSGAA